MRNTIISTTLVLMSACSCFAQPRQYTLISDSPQFDGSPYGFSGTITTDGSLGSFTDVDFITDWSITLATPGDDGVTTQVLTPFDTRFESVHGGGGDFVVSPTNIFISYSDYSLPSTLRLRRRGGDTFIDWSSPGWSLYESFYEGGIKIHDLDSTIPDSGFHVFGGLHSLPVATDGVATCELAKLGLLEGDLDGDGSVALADFLELSANFGMNVDSYQQGDIDCNGTVELADFLALSANFGKSSQGIAAVPEPASWLIFVIGALVLTTRSPWGKSMP